MGVPLRVEAECVTVVYILVATRKTVYDHVHESVSLVARKCYLFLELLALFGRERVCFCDQRDDVDLLVQPLHELDVQGLQPGDKQGVWGGKGGFISLTFEPKRNIRTMLGYKG